MQPLQNRWLQLDCTGSRSPKRQIGHSYLLSNGGSKYSSYPSDLGSSCDDKGLNETSSEEVTVEAKTDNSSPKEEERRAMITSNDATTATTKCELRCSRNLTLLALKHPRHSPEQQRIKEANPTNSCFVTWLESCQTFRFP